MLPNLCVVMALLAWPPRSGNAKSVGTGLLVVDLDGAAEGIQKIRKRGLHPVPVGNHRVAQRIVEIFTRGAPDAAHKGADRQFFPVAIVSSAR